MLPTPSVSALSAPQSARPQPTRKGARNDGHIGESARTWVERLRSHPHHLRGRDAVLVVIGIFILRRATWAELAGIAAAFLGALVNLFWTFSYPLVSILAITLCLLAVYGLTTYSLEELD